MLKITAALAFVAMSVATPSVADPVPTTPGTPAPAGTYDFSFSGGSYIGSGTVTTDASGHVTDISGLLSDSSATASITGVDALYGAPDNNLFVTPAFVTIAGISFDTDTLGAFNLANNLLGDYILASSTTNAIGASTGALTTVSLNVQAVPEAPTWAMLLLGFAAIGVAMRRGTRRLPQMA